MMLFFWQYDSLTYVVILMQFTPGSSGQEGGEGVTHEWTMTELDGNMYCGHCTVYLIWKRNRI